MSDEIKILTQEKEAEYLNSDGCTCPFCGQSNITTDEIGELERSIDINIVTQDIQCPDCKRHWTEQFVRTKILAWECENTFNEVEVKSNGYTWKCPQPNCKEINVINKLEETVTCSYCNVAFAIKGVK